MCAFNRCRGERGGSGGKVRRVSGSWGRGEHVEQSQNHRHICCSSQMFPINLSCFQQPCSSESVLSCQEKRGGLCLIFF